MIARCHRRGRRERASGSALLLFILLPLACQRPSRQPDPAPPPPPAVDPDFQDGQLHARSYSLTSWIDTSQIGPFARLSPSQRDELRALQSRPDQQLSVLEARGRLLLILPPSHPAGPLEIIIGDRLAVYSPDRRLRVSLPRDRLLDLLDGARTSARSDLEIEVKTAPARAGDRLPTVGARVRRLSVKLALRYLPTPDKPRGWPLRVRFRGLIPDELPGRGVDQPMLQLALPLLVGSGTLPSLEEIAAHGGPLLRWSTTIVNEGRPAAVTPTIRTDVVFHGYQRVACELFSTARRGYTTVRALLGRRDDGRQLATDAVLGRLRSASTAGPLRVTNHSAAAAKIYADGALLGWVAPRRTISFRGLSAGYYRIYAVSGAALQAWGPFDLYVPGPLTLD
jgi:hypothetical protein